MSHIGKYKTTITNANKEIGKIAISLLAERMKIELVTEDYTNVFGVRFDKNNANLGVLKVAHGLGIHINSKGELEINGDAYNHIKLFNEVKDKIQQYYKAVAVNMALEELGFTVESSMNEEAEFIIVGDT